MKVYKVEVNHKLKNNLNRGEDYIINHSSSAKSRMTILDYLLDKISLADYVDFKIVEVTPNTFESDTRYELEVNNIYVVDEKLGIAEFTPADIEYTDLREDVIDYVCQPFPSEENESNLDDLVDQIEKLSKDEKKEVLLRLMNY